MKDIIDNILLKVDFQNKLLIFLRNIYNKNTCIDENKLKGRKNKTNSFEEFIELQCKEYFPNNYQLHPYGCQKPPDFIICNEYFKVYIECKSSNSYVPTWNCSIPQSGWIYIHKNTKTQHITFFQASDIMTFEESECLKQISKQVSEFSQNVSDMWGFYPRNMFVQRKKLPQDRNVLFQSICDNLSSLIHNKTTLRLHKEFSNISYELTKQLTIEEKKEFGIFFTPKTIRDMVWNTLPKTLQKKKLLEPSCGGGDFLNDAIDKNLDIVGVEINKTIYEKIKNDNIIHHDFLLWKADTYDIIIGNPPYFLLSNEQKLLYEHLMFKKGKTNIFELFIYKSLDLLKKNGYLSFVLPTSLMNTNSYQDLRNIIMKYEIIECKKVPDEFLDTKQNCFILTIKKTKNKTNKYIFNNQLIFEEERQFYKTIFDNTTLMKNLSITIETGKIVWNQHKNDLSLDSKDILLLYDFNIINNKIVLYDEKYNNKGQFIKIDKETLNSPVIIVSRGNGNGNWKMKCALVEFNRPFLCENHLYIIKGELDCLKQIYKQFISNEFQDFIKKLIPNKCLTKQNLLELPIKMKY